MCREPALLTSGGRMPERSQHRVSGGQDARSERPATGHGQPRTVPDTQVAHVRCFALGRQQVFGANPPTSASHGCDAQ